MSADLATVTVSDVIARHPCGDWAARIPALVAPYRRERWSALEILSLDAVPAADRLWVCLDESLVPRRVLVRFACEVAAEAMRLTGWTDPRSWAALGAQMAYARGEIDAAASAAARDAARDAAWAASAAACGAASSAASNSAWAAYDAACTTTSAAAWAASSAASNAARAASAAPIRTLRTLILLDLDGYDVLRGELGGVVPPPKGESK